MKHALGSNSRWVAVFSAAGLLVSGVACTPISFLNNTSSLGGDAVGRRGNLDVAFINNTPYRAIFTFGVYDPLSLEFSERFDQYFAAEDPASRLEGNSEGELMTFTCGRALSVGGDQMLARIRDGGGETTEGVNVDALAPGVAFSDKPLDDPDANMPTAGRADGRDTLIGVDFECGSLLIFTFEEDPNEPDGFRIDLEVFPP